MPSSKDITTYDQDILDLMLAALSKPITLTFDSLKDMQYVRGRIYGARNATKFSWEEKQRLEKKNLSIEHLKIPIIEQAPSIISITTLVDGTTLTVGRRLLRVSAKTTIQKALLNANITRSEEGEEKSLNDMMKRLSVSNKEEEEGEEQNIYKNL